MLSGIVLCTPTDARAQSFTGLGDLTATVVGSYALGVSPDGSMVVGYGTNAFGDTEGFVWTASGGMEGLSGQDAVAGDYSIATAVSNAGDVVGSADFTACAPSCAFQ